MTSKLINILMPYYQRLRYYQKPAWDKLALKYMKACDRILDVGCGNGRFISCDPQRIVGVDHNENSVEICRQKGFDVKYGKVTELPFPDSSFDAVHCCHVIEHLLPEDAHRLLSEISRVLKTAGILCLRSPLFSSGFYFNFTHIKPYYPQAVLHYFETHHDQSQSRTLPVITAGYKIIRLKYRRKRLFGEMLSPVLNRFSPIFNILARFGIRSFKKTGYMLVLKKI